MYCMVYRIKAKICKPWKNNVLVESKYIIKFKFRHNLFTNRLDMNEKMCITLLSMFKSILMRE